MKARPWLIQNEWNRWNHWNQVIILLLLLYFLGSNLFRTVPKVLSASLRWLAASRFIAWVGVHARDGTTGSGTTRLEPTALQKQG